MNKRIVIFLFIFISLFGLAISNLNKFEFGPSVCEYSFENFDTFGSWQILDNEKVIGLLTLVGQDFTINAWPNSLSNLTGTYEYDSSTGVLEFTFDSNSFVEFTDSLSESILVESNFILDIVEERYQVDIQIEFDNNECSLRNPFFFIDGIKFTK